MSFELTYQQIEELKRKLNVYKDALKNPNLSQHYKKINKGTIATEYYDYSKVTTFLILSQLIILFLSLLQDETPNKFTYSSYFIALLIIIFIGINNIILTYFSTDG